MNRLVIYLLLMVLFFVIICTIFGGFFEEAYTLSLNRNGIPEGKDYLYPFHIELDTAFEIIKILFNLFIVYNTFIPISLVIALEVCKAIQAFFIELDSSMKRNQDDKMKVLSLKIQEDLGNLKYVFSDKTGTLTKNELELKVCSIFGKIFEEDLNSTVKRRSNFFTEKFNAENLVKALEGDLIHDLLLPEGQVVNLAEATKQFFLNIALNHNVILDEEHTYSMLIEEEKKREEERKNLSKKSKSSKNVLKVEKENELSRKETFVNKENPNFIMQGDQNAKENDILSRDYDRDVYKKKNNSFTHKNTNEFKTKKPIDHEIKYQGANPDEVVLVSVAKDIGIKFLDRDTEFIRVEVNGSEEEFKILYKFDFTSSRMRSSIIVRDHNNVIRLYIKGADSVILAPSKLDDISCDYILPKTKMHLEDLSKNGLRSLCYSYKEVPEEEFLVWERRYLRIKAQSLVDKTLDKQLDGVISEIENNAFLLGVTGLEDKLQNKVPNVLQELLEAGINVWMLTGDKLDTAESIGFACRLFRDDTEVFKIRSSLNNQAVTNKLKNILKDMIHMENEMKINQFYNDSGSYSQNLVKNPSMDEIKEDKKTAYHELYRESNEIPSEEEYRNMFSRVKNFFQEENEFPIMHQSDIIEMNYDMYSVIEEIPEDNIIKYIDDIKPIRKGTAIAQVQGRFEKLNDESILRFMNEKQFFDGGLTLEKNISGSKILGELKREESHLIPKEQELKNNYPDDNKNLFVINELGSDLELKKITSKGILGKKKTRELDIEKIMSNYNKSYDVTALNLVKNPSEKLAKIKEESKEEDQKLGFNTLRDEANNRKQSLTQVEGSSIYRNNKLKIMIPEDRANKEHRKSGLEKALPAEHEQLNINALTDALKIYDGKIKKINNINRSSINFNFQNFVKKDIEENSGMTLNFGLVIEGDAITHCLHEDNQVIFWKILQKCRSIVCARCNPLQKAEVVKFVKHKSKSVTLAIGDGGNDVNMIKCANVGIGIFGKEGSQAAYNSDYAISQFKYLRELIFKHGRFSLLRNSYFIYFFFFKNLLFTFPQFWFGLYNGFSGTNYWDEWYYLSYNSYLTTLNIAVKMIWDQDLDIEFKGYKHKSEARL